MSVQFDVLDDVLNTIRLHGTVYFQKQFAGDWGVETAKTPFKKFHIIAQGECWLQAPFLPSPVCLRSGDIAAFPHGSPYRLSAHLDSPCVSSDTLLGASARNEPLFGDGEVSATIVFGHVEFTRDFNHPFVSRLPALIHVQANANDHQNKLHAIADLIVSETAQARPGSGSIAKRLAEVLHLYTLRAHILTQRGDTSFPAVFNESTIYQALQLIHSQVDTDWTLERLASQVNLSRTSFATRFRDMLGIPPMQYITMWRMQKARELLETTSHPLIVIALAVGYGSEAAFSRAFQREFDQTPGRFRQSFKAGSHNRNTTIGNS